jgi:SAM-dependent methyltransferase
MLGGVAEIASTRIRGETMNAPVREHNLKAAAMWSGGGRAYDEISRSIAGAIQHTVTRLNPARGERVADVATGTGWTSREVARRGADVVGVDIAEGLLAAARDIAREQGLAITYELGDAEALPFGDGAFDAVISTFGVMFAADQQRAATELARICRPGGRVAIAAWTPDSQAVSLRKVLVPFMAPPPSPSPSPFVWGTPDWVGATLGRDFRVNSEEGTVMTRFASAEASWEAHVNGFGPVTAVAASLDEARRKELRQAFIAWTEQFRTGLGVTIPLEYLVTVGDRV